MANIVRTGGSNTKLNVFCQPNEPEKKQGIWLKTNGFVSPKKVVCENSVWAEEQWIIPSPVTKMAESRVSACCAALGNEIFIFGGRGNRYLATATAYNSANNSYRNLAPLPEYRYDACCTVGSDNNIYIIGGYAANDNSRYFKRYNPQTDTYTTFSFLSYSLYRSCCAAINDEIYIFGGKSNLYLSAAWAYNTQTKTYRNLSRLSDWRGRSCCAAIADNVYIFGGSDESTYYTSALRYNTVSDTYTYIASMGSERADSCCTVVGNEIFLFGGTNGDNSLRSAIAYHPESNTFRPIQSMPDNRKSSCCALLGDKVYIFGGENESSYFSTVNCLSLISKQYANDPTVVIYYLPKDTSHYASLMENHQMSWHPTYFKDAMLYINGKVTFPAVYCGDGENWNLIREEQ